MKSGDDCIMTLQIVQNGVKTGWARQYDLKTLQPLRRACI
ncbi:MAG: pectate lyase [Candidatus Malihini olakiniferum]